MREYASTSTITSTSTTTTTTTTTNNNKKSRFSKCATFLTFGFVIVWVPLRSVMDTQELFYESVTVRFKLILKC